MKKKALLVEELEEIAEATTGTDHEPVASTHRQTHALKLVLGAHLHLLPLRR